MGSPFMCVCVAELSLHMVLCEAGWVCW